MISRVIDRQAIVDKETRTGLITIVSKSYERRLIEADGLITLVQECRESIARDAWETEGCIKTAYSEWTAVYYYTGDKKCSSSTYWNTGNPRHLVERWVVPVEASRSMDIASLHNLLERKFARATYADKGQPASPWYRAGWEELQEIVEKAVMDRTVLSPKIKKQTIDYGTPTDVVYLMSETETDWVKIGKCGSSTSPPAKRRSMYQPGNRREILPVAAWTINGKNPEAAMKAELKAYCRSSSQNCRSEWFDLGVGKALDLLASVVPNHARVSSSSLGHR